MAVFFPRRLLDDDLAAFFLPPDLARLALRRVLFLADFRAVFLADFRAEDLRPPFLAPLRADFLVDRLPDFLADFLAPAFLAVFFRGRADRVRAAGSSLSP